MTATDFLGTPLAVGDRVIYTRLRYRDLSTGYIKKITPCMVFIGKKEETDPGNWVKQAHNQVIKYEK
jgi:hypothetical protein